MHVEFLLIDNGKMSKSLNNVYLLDDLENRGIEPLAFRYLCFTSHYRNKLNFTWESIDSANKSLQKLRMNIQKHKEQKGKVKKEEIKQYEKQFLDAINDDLNMTSAISIVWEIAKKENKSSDYYKLLMKFDEVLSLNLDKEIFNKVDVNEEIEELLKKRKIARENKNYVLSDELRDKIKEKGYLVKDTKDGQILENLNNYK